MKRRVLVAEDNPYDLAGILAIVSASLPEIELVSVANVRDFSARFRRGKWSLILLDPMMPNSATESAVDKDAGMKIVKRLAAQGNRVPVVVLTARWRSDKALEEFKEFPFVVQPLLFKPIDGEALTEVVRNALGCGERESGTGPRSDKSSPVKPDSGKTRRDYFRSP